MLDDRLPDLDGVAVATELSRTREHGTARIVLLTTDEGPETRARAARAGIAACLCKPIVPSQLRRLLQRSAGEVAPTAGQPGADAPVPAEEQRGCRILLAEDNVVNQRIAMRLLERAGHTVVVAGNGREAVDAFRAGGFDLVLMDVQMPEMDGLEATAAIRHIEVATGTHVPIIATTANAFTQDRHDCLHAGMDDFLAKPIRAADLHAVIDRMTRHAAASVQTPVAAL